jgi:hypothetical protein
MSSWRARLDVTLEKYPLAIALSLSVAYTLAFGLGHVFNRYDCLLFPIVAWLIVRALSHLKGRAQLFAWMGVSTMLVLGVLTHLWTTGHEGRTAVLLGIAPFADAGEFFSDTQRMIYGLPFVHSSRRPLYVAVASGVLRWSGNELRTMLAIFAVVHGLAIGFVGREVMRFHGRIASFVVLVILFFWARRFTGFVAMEALAFPLGALGFGLLLRAAHSAGARPRDAANGYAVGLFAITLALVARPGSMLVVPMLVFWGIRLFRGRDRIFALARGAAALGTALVIVRVLTAHVASGPTFGDYPNIFYGLVHRADIHQIEIDHPEISQLPLEERGSAIMRVLQSDIARDPSLAVKGPLEALLSFLGGPHGFFSFVWTNPDDHVLEDGPLVKRIIAEQGYLGPVMHWIHELGAMSLLNAIVMGAMGAAFVIGTLIAVVQLARKRSDPVFALYGYVMVGVIASSIFAPTWIGEGMQMNTAVFAFVPAAMAVGLFHRAQMAMTAQTESRSDRRLLVTTLAVPAFCALLVIATVAAPLRAERTACGGNVMTARLCASTRVVRRPNDALATNLKFLKKHNPVLVESVSAVAEPNGVMAIIYDSCTDRTRIAFGQDDVVPKSEAWAPLAYEPQKEPTVVHLRPR